MFITKKMPKSLSAEAYRSLRTSIKFSSVDRPIKTLVVTSSIMGEGKSTVAGNIANILSQDGARVLMIDCDLRKNTLHKYMGLSNKHGLTDALLEYRQTKKLNVEYFQNVKDPSFAGTMAVLTSGIHIPNPSELLGSHVFKDYINELKKAFDFIIIDCAPVGMISDAIPVGNAVDGTIFAISSQDTNKKDAANCVKLLQRNNVNVLGSVLTKAKSISGSHYYYY